MTQERGGGVWQIELGLAEELEASDSGRRLSSTESVSLHLSSDYISELGSGAAWDDFRLTKGEIAADPEAAALATYFRQVYIVARIVPPWSLCTLEQRQGVTMA